MTIENSEETAQLGVTDPAEKPGLEPSSSSTDSVQDAAPRVEPPSGVIEAAPVAGTHDSSPPFSRKLAPPPKPKRDSGAASAPPSARPGEGPDLVAAASALKAPIPPTISFASVPTLENPPGVVTETSPEIAPPPIAPLSQPPPMRRRSSPSFSDAGAPNVPPVATPPGVRMSSDPALVAGDAPAAKETSVAPRPMATPPRPRSDPPGPRLRADSAPSMPDAAAPAVPASAAGPTSASPSSPPGFPAPSTSPSAIFAMRIIAVGDSARSPASQEQTPELDPDSYPPSGSRLGTTVRRSSRPAPAPAASAVAAPAPIAEPIAVAPADAPVAAVAPADAPVAAVAPADAPVAAGPVADSAVAAPAAASLTVASVPFMVPPAPPMPTDLGPSIEIDVPIDVELPAANAAPTADTIAALDAAAAALEASSVEAPSAPMSSPNPEKRRPPAPPPPVELSDDQFSAEAIHKKIAAAEAAEAAAAARTATGPAPIAPPAEAAAPAEASPATTESASSAPAAAPGDGTEELGREDAISMPPEEVAVEDAAKPPPPPKRAAAAALAPASAPVVESAPPSAPPKEPPPTPDPAAAKAAQRAKTRQPWWEDLFNEDFMRASSRVSDEAIRREVTFIEESLGVAAGGVVLDLGCGAGHHAVEFASRGYGVVGYDLSLYQLALAADVAQERSQKINFLQGDMREMAFEEMFDGVFCWNTTFGYFEEDKNLAVAQRVFKALRPGGMFLIDVLNRDFAAASAPCTVWYEGDSCVCMDDMSVDYISSRLRVKRSIILDDGRTKESLFSLRLYSLHELGKLLHEVGFRVTEASGHPATPGVFFGPNSPRIIMLAQRP